MTCNDQLLTNNAALLVSDSALLISGGTLLTCRYLPADLRWCVADVLVTSVCMAGRSVFRGAASVVLIPQVLGKMQGTVRLMDANAMRKTRAPIPAAVQR